MNKKMMKFSLLSVSLILTSAGAVTSAIPSMSATYATRSLSAVELLTTAPSFMVTIFVLISSFIARKIGQKQTVIIGLVIASIYGILPLFSQSYSIVLASRAGLGIGFGLINSLAVSMIAAFYHGDERASMIGFQSAFQGFGAALMTFVAGQLVQFGWQYTFLVYAISLPILVLFVLFVPTPETTELQSHGTAPTRQVIKTNPKMISYGIFLLLVIVVYNAVSIKLATVLTTYSLGNETNAAINNHAIGKYGCRSLFWLASDKSTSLYAYTFFTTDGNRLCIDCHCDKPVCDWVWCDPNRNFFFVIHSLLIQPSKYPSAQVRGEFQYFNLIGWR